jgi:hypothetical protein
MIKSRMMMWTGHDAWERTAYRFLVRKPVHQEPLGRARYRWEETTVTGYLSPCVLEA